MENITPNKGVGRIHEYIVNLSKDIRALFDRVNARIANIIADIELAAHKQVDLERRIHDLEQEVNVLRAKLQNTQDPMI